MLNEFCEYLEAQINEPYLWGGQHTALHRSDYKKIIRAAEANTGGYPNGESYADAVIKYCTERFSDPAVKVLYAYDCSGLGCYWLYNLKHLIPTDMTAQRMTSECIITNGDVHRGYWVFRFNTAGTKISHIGYMIDDNFLIEAKGRRYGVKKTPYRRAEWDLSGIPKCFISEIAPKVHVIGNNVYIRDRDNKSGKILKVAHKGEKYPCVGIALSGWYEIFIPDLNRVGYISNRPDLTELK